MQSRQRQRADVEPFVPLGGDAASQLEDRRRGLAAHGQQDPRGAVDEPPDRVGEDRRRGVVEPLGVVDRDDQRPGVGQRAQQRCRGHRQRPLVRQLAGWLGAQDGDLDGVPLDGGQGCELAVGDGRQEVGQAAEGERPFGLSWRRSEDPCTTLGGPLDPGPPDRGLADPRFADDQQARRTRSCPLEQPLDRLELRRAADQVGVHRTTRLPGLGRAAAAAN